MVVLHLSTTLHNILHLYLMARKGTTLTPVASIFPLVSYHMTCHAARINLPWPIDHEVIRKARRSDRSVNVRLRTVLHDLATSADNLKVGEVLHVETSRTSQDVDFVVLPSYRFEASLRNSSDIIELAFDVVTNKRF